MALYAYLARTPAQLISVSLADAVGDRRAQNLPGTSTEYPNWQIPLCDPGGRAVLLENLPAIPLVRAVAQAVCAARRSRGFSRRRRPAGGSAARGPCRRGPR